MLVDDYDLVAPAGGAGRPAAAARRVPAAGQGRRAARGPRPALRWSGPSAVRPRARQAARARAPGSGANGSPDEGALVGAVKPGRCRRAGPRWWTAAAGARRVQLAWLPPEPDTGPGASVTGWPSQPGTAGVRVATADRRPGCSPSCRCRRPVRPVRTSPAYSALLDRPADELAGGARSAARRPVVPAESAAVVRFVPARSAARAGIRRRRDGRRCRGAGARAWSSTAGGTAAPTLVRPRRRPGRGRPRRVPVGGAPSTRHRGRRSLRPARRGRGGRGAGSARRCPCCRRARAGSAGRTSTRCARAARRWRRCRCRCRPGAAPGRRRRGAAGRRGGPDAAARRAARRGRDTPTCGRPAPDAPGARRRVAPAARRPTAARDASPVRDPRGGPAEPSGCLRPAPAATASLRAAVAVLAGAAAAPAPSRLPASRRHRVRRGRPPAGGARPVRLPPRLPAGWEHTGGLPDGGAACSSPSARRDGSDLIAVERTPLGYDAAAEPERARPSCGPPSTGRARVAAVRLRRRRRAAGRAGRQLPAGRGADPPWSTGTSCSTATPSSASVAGTPPRTAAVVAGVRGVVALGTARCAEAARSHLRTRFPDGHAAPAGATLRRHCHGTGQQRTETTWRTDRTADGSRRVRHDDRGDGPGRHGTWSRSTTTVQADLAALRGQLAPLQGGGRRGGHGRSAADGALGRRRPGAQRGAAHHRRGHPGLRRRATSSRRGTHTGMSAIRAALG